MARFLIDESLPLLLEDALQQAGHDATHATSIGLGGALDEEVYERAQSMDATLLARDLDFADERRFRGGAGIVVVRLRSRETIATFSEIVVRLLADVLAETDDLSGRIIILEPGRTRIRRR